MKISEYKKIGRRNKYNAQRVEFNGIKFDSKMECEWYKENYQFYDHIDCHVPVTLPGGIRFNIDFICWGEIGGDFQRAVEIKGRATQDFKTKRKLFDQFHPLGPLEVYTKKGNIWESI